MLELKLQEHSPHVDHFVITESNVTYNQIDKPYRLEQQWSRYAQWHDRITYLKFDGSGLEPGWPTEHAQREHGIGTVIPDKDDIVLITDLDEFLGEKQFDLIRNNIDKKREMLFNMSCYWCFADVLHNRKQKAIAACRYKNYINSTTHRRPQKMFEHRQNPFEDTLVVEGGLHLTWMGDREQFEQKLLGSIEGHKWSKDRTNDEMWESRANNRLFHWKDKFKKGETRHVPLAENEQLTKSMKQFILQKHNWLLDSTESS